MNTIDIIIGIILLVAFFMGFSKGLLRVLASLIGLVAGVYCGIYFSGYVEAYLVRWFDWSHDINRIASFLITFFLVMVLFGILGRILTKVADFALMGIFNKLLGGVFNILKIVFLLSVIFMFINASENYSILTPEKRDSSLFYHPIESVAPMILPTIEKHMDDLDLDPILDYRKEKQTDSIP